MNFSRQTKSAHRRQLLTQFGQNLVRIFLCNGLGMGQSGRFFTPVGLWLKFLANQVHLCCAVADQKCKIFFVMCSLGCPQLDAIRRWDEFLAGIDAAQARSRAASPVPRVTSRNGARLRRLLANG